MKTYKGRKPHEKMQEPFVTMPDTTNAKRKGAINKLMASLASNNWRRLMLLRSQTVAIAL